MIAVIGYCAECKELGTFPWQHSKDCIEGMRHRLRWYEIAFFWILLLLFGETALLVVAFLMLGRFV